MIRQFPSPLGLLAGSLLAGSVLFASLPIARAFTQNPATVFINEIHYDNVGTDTGEAIEIAGPAGTNLGGWSLVLYNGTGGAVYTTTPLSGTIPNQQNGFGTVVFTYPSNGIQNGSPDGVALVNSSGQVIQFLSYEGSFTAVGGAANGLASTDIGVSEPDSTPVGRSLRLTGTGSTYQDFTWAAPDPNSFGAINTGQSFTATPSATISLAVNPNSFSEGAGATAATGTVSRTGSTTAELVVSLTSSDTTEATVPASVTIPAGASQVSFAVAAIDDSVVDGNQQVTITASAAGFTSTTATVTVSDNDAVSTTRIRDIQGRGHISALNGQQVTNVPGIVTALSFNGFFIQDPAPDSDDATSEGLFVFTGSAPTVTVGSSVQVTGTVQEFRRRNSNNDPPTGTPSNLTITQISGSPTVSVLSTGNPLPAPIVIGAGGRVPPQTVIDDDATGNVETTGTFDPATDGIDFYESLEGMRVQVNDAVATSPTSVFSAGSNNENREISVLPNNAGGPRTPTGGIYVSATDFNPERVILGDNLIPAGTNLPDINVGASFPGTIVGIIDYSFGNFKFQVSGTVPTPTGGAVREVTADPTPTQLTVATFNVENLDPGDGAARFNAIAGNIVLNLKSPDIVSLEEVQDNNGATNNGIVDATTTLTTLVNAIAAAGGPSYQFRVINPVNNQDGGEPGGNIRVAFLYNPARVQFIDRAAPSGANLSITPVGVTSGPAGVQLTFSPGRIDPTNSAFNNSRKPLVGEFLFGGRKVFIVGNHFNSKGGDDPLFGTFQPPTLVTEAQRRAQATLVNSFVQQVLSVDPGANVLVLGDLNDFTFSAPLTILKQGGVLTNLYDLLNENERYSYVFQGNTQALDHILASSSLFSVAQFDAVHINSEFADQLSDHDPLVARFNLPPLPLAVGDVSPASAPVGGTVTLTGVGFTGTTSVLFYNNRPASFTVVSDTQITLSVPAGAVTGPIQVRKPGARTSSAGKFQVISGNSTSRLKRW